LAALWISIFQHSQQQQHCLSHHVPSWILSKTCISVETTSHLLL
jgi:hypothetical protein